MRKTNLKTVFLCIASVGIFLLSPAGEIQAEEIGEVNGVELVDFPLSLENLGEQQEQPTSNVTYLGEGKFLIEGESIVGGKTQTITCEIAVDKPFVWIEVPDPTPEVVSPIPIYYYPPEEPAEEVLPPILFSAPIYNFGLDELEGVLIGLTAIPLPAVEGSFAIGPDGDFVITQADGVLQGTNGEGDVIVPREIALAGAEDPHVLVAYLLAQNEDNPAYTREDAVETAAAFQLSFNEAAEDMSELTNIELTDEQEDAAQTILADHMSEATLGGATDEKEQALLFATPEGDVFIASFDTSEEGRIEITYFEVPEALKDQSIEKIAAMFEGLEGMQVVYSADPVGPYDYEGFVSQETAILVAIYENELVLGGGNEEIGVIDMVNVIPVVINGETYAAYYEETYWGTTIVIANVPSLQPGDTVVIDGEVFDAAIVTESGTINIANTPSLQPGNTVQISGQVYTSATVNNSGSIVIANTPSYQPGDTISIGGQAYNAYVNESGTIVIGGQ